MGSKKPENANTDILPEYDFTGGVRGKHAKQYEAGHRVKVRRADGSVTVQHFTLEDGAVLLEPDVREYFSDSESVNHALRSLINLAPKKRQARRRAARR